MPGMSRLMLNRLMLNKVDTAAFSFLKPIEEVRQSAGDAEWESKEL
jgi:hypothetical protein